MPATDSRGARVAEGRTAEIFAWGDDRVLKLFRNGFPRSIAQREATSTRAVHAAGLPVPAVHEVVEVEGRHGLVLDRVRGPSMLDEIIERPWTTRRHARMLADLQARFHATAVSGLPLLRPRLENRIRSAGADEPALRDDVLAELAALQDGNAVCHGDFHPGNVLMTSTGPRIIDWLDAATGDPAADVARTLLLIGVSALPEGIRRRWLVQLVRGAFRAAYWNRYRGSHREIAERALAWRRPVAAARIDEGIPEELDRLLEIVRSAR